MAVHPTRHDLGRKIFAHARLHPNKRFFNSPSVTNGS